MKQMTAISPAAFASLKPLGQCNGPLLACCMEGAPVLSQRFHGVVVPLPWEEHGPLIGIHRPTLIGCWHRPWELLGQYIFNRWQQL